MLNFLKRWISGSKPGHDRVRERLVVNPDHFAAIYAIGDVHGCVDQLADAERRIRTDSLAINGKKLVVLLGDYVDKGADSAGVLSYLCVPSTMDFYRVCLCGNHDDEFMRFLDMKKPDKAWLDFGGLATLRSYGLDTDYLLRKDPSGRELQAAARQVVPPSHVEFLRQAPVSLQTGQTLFVHAGIVPGMELEEQTDADMMWIREPFLAKGPELDLTVVHGHTPVASVDFGINRIGIDTGAYISGKLSVLRLSGGEFTVL